MASCTRLLAGAIVATTALPGQPATAKAWWWPDAEEQDSWPSGVARIETVQAFREAFATLGYADCDHEQLEPAWEKIALFALAGIPKHAARQLPTGRWTSKLGPLEDIEHGLHYWTLAKNLSQKA